MKLFVSVLNTRKYLRNWTKLESKQKLSEQLKYASYMSIAFKVSTKLLNEYRSECKMYIISLIEFQELIKKTQLALIPANFYCKDTFFQSMNYCQRI